MLILNIETSTNTCSVSLSGETGVVLAYRENIDDRSHSTLLTVFIEEVIKEAGITADKLSAVSVSMGPGSYTGLRIGTSTAKGICYAKSIPLISINTLDILTKSFIKRYHQLLEVSKNKILLCPMLDARRMEVYLAMYNTDGLRIKDTAAEIINEDTFVELLKENIIYFFGNGVTKCKEIIHSPNAKFMDGFYPSANDMGELSLKLFQKAEFENLSLFEPFYLKDFVAKQSNNSIK